MVVSYFSLRLGSLLKQVCGVRNRIAAQLRLGVNEKNG